MLTPMQLQYLVALCCRKREPDAVDIIVGDMVEDPAAEKERDVDVTVTVREPDGSLAAFMAYEVKREGEPLDLITVEGLCTKLEDMISVTHRAIVSSSGYSKAAIKKAKAHGVELYIWKPWTKPLSEQFPEFPDLGTPSEFIAGFYTNLLTWINYKFHLIVNPDTASFSWTGETPIVTKSGSPHPNFSNLDRFVNPLLLRSTTMLFPIEPAQTILRTYPILATDPNLPYAFSPAWPHTHTIGTSEDQVFLARDTGPMQVVAVLISGFLQWQRRKRTPEFHMMENLSGEIFAAAAVADYGEGDGRMLVLVFPPDSRETDVHIFQLSEKHKNSIRNLRIPRVEKSP